jgi:hypothetical protein
MWRQISRFFMRKITFPKVLTAVVLGYILYCSFAQVENAIAYIGFMLSLVTLWVYPPGGGGSGKNSDSQGPRW